MIFNQIISWCFDWSLPHQANNRFRGREVKGSSIGILMDCSLVKMVYRQYTGIYPRNFRGPTLKSASMCACQIHRASPVLQYAITHPPLLIYGASPVLQYAICHYPPPFTILVKEGWGGRWRGNGIIVKLDWPLWSNLGYCLLIHQGTKS